MDIADYQELAQRTDHSNRQPWIGLAQNVFGLTEKLGLLSGCLKKQIRDGVAYQTFDEDVRREVGETLWYLSSVCTHLGLSLDEIARENLQSNEARWEPISRAQGSLFTHLLDAELPEGEQLPRRFLAEFTVKTDPAKSWLSLVEVKIDGVPFGDAIDDNTAREDFYRLHDIIHIAHAAILGWSPVLRALLRRKRKSRPDIDKFQDGARARDNEEALARLIHTEAKRTNFFDGVDALDTTFLMKIQSIVADLEVSVRQPSEWQHCILEAYKVFRLLRDHRGGIVEASLVERKLTFTPRPNTDAV